MLAEQKIDVGECIFAQRSRARGERYDMKRMLAKMISHLKNNLLKRLCSSLYI